jgi:hypothetical protein
LAAQQKLLKDNVMFDSFSPKILSRWKLSNILVTHARISLSLLHATCPSPHSLKCSDLSPRCRPWPRAATYAQSPRRPVSLHRTAPNAHARPLRSESRRTRPPLRHCPTLLRHRLCLRAAATAVEPSKDITKTKTKTKEDVSDESEEPYKDITKIK